jgi:hypothetical protein
MAFDFSLDPQYTLLKEDCQKKDRLVDKHATEGGGFFFLLSQKIKIKFNFTRIEMSVEW